MQTELGGTTYLDTEPWRGEPLLGYLRKMVFWSDVAPNAADLAVLSLLGPRLADGAGTGRAGRGRTAARMVGGATASRWIRAPDARAPRTAQSSWICWYRATQRPTGGGG